MRQMSCNHGHVYCHINPQFYHILSFITDWHFHIILYVNNAETMQHLWDEMKDPNLEFESADNLQGPLPCKVRVSRDLKHFLNWWISLTEVFPMSGNPTYTNLIEIFQQLHAMTTCWKFQLLEPNFVDLLEKSKLNFCSFTWKKKFAALQSFLACSS